MFENDNSDLQAAEADERRRAYRRKYYHTHKERLKQWAKGYAEKNKDKLSDWRKAYYERNKEKITQYNKEYWAGYKRSKSKHGYYQTLQGRYSQYKRSAKKRGLPFELTEEQFASLWQKNCSYCGDPIETIGLDRINNTKGYVLDNVVPCCDTCNRMKLDLTQDNWLNHMRKILIRSKMPINLPIIVSEGSKENHELG